MSKEASGSNTKRTLRDIPPIDYKELNRGGGIGYVDFFNSYRSIGNKAETDSSSSSPFVSPLSTPTVQSESEEVDQGNQSSNITLRPSQLKTHTELRMEQQDTILVELASLSEDISDHLDEYPTESFVVIEDIDLSVLKLESLRKQFRTNANLLKQLAGDANYNKHYKNDHEKTKCHIKAYIHAANAVKTQLRQREIEKDKQSTVEKEEKLRSESSRDTKTANFLRAEVNRMIIDLAALFDTDIDLVSNDELIQLKDKLPEVELTLE